MERKKKLRIIQFGLLFAGLLIFFLTYFNQDNASKKKEIVSENLKSKIELDVNKNNKKENDLNTFYNIQYSGLDASGNRYILKSKEATTTEPNNELISMRDVEAFFYFKDDTVLTVNSKKAEYNDKTLDIKFFEKVEAFYDDAKLFANKAEYSNSKNFIIIENDVEITNSKGNIFADKLLFDIRSQNLNITSFKNSKINANIDLNEKRF